jgi:hypothetical protein
MDSTKKRNKKLLVGTKSILKYRITIFVDIIQEKTIDKDLGTKSEAMGFQFPTGFRDRFPTRDFPF